MPTLTFHHWYINDAVYLDGELIYWDRSIREWPLLQVLGYQCERGEEIPTHNIPPDFDRDANGHWQPPQSLAVLREQIVAWKERERQEKIAALKDELARLEGTSQ